jgi:hypothetical protein
MDPKADDTMHQRSYGYCGAPAVDSFTAKLLHRAGRQANPADP